MLEQLKRELKIHFYLNSPNIIKVYGFFDDVLSCYIIEECVLDGHLSSHIKQTVGPIL